MNKCQYNYFQDFVFLQILQEQIKNFILQAKHIDVYQLHCAPTAKYKVVGCIQPSRDPLKEGLVLYCS